MITEITTITISTEEYRALIEASVAQKYSARIAELEQQLKETQDENVERGAQLYARRQKIEALERDVEELRNAGERMAAYIDSDAMIRADFNLFDAARAAEGTTDENAGE